MRPSVLSLISFVISPAFVGASLYPTEPVQATVWQGGGWNTITWVDNHSPPSLHKLGLLSITLWKANKHFTYLADLAKNVDPKKMSHRVFIPEGSCSSCVIIIKSTKETYYTANFAITNMTGNRTPPSGSKLRQPSANSGTATTLSSTTLATARASGPGGGNNDLVTVTMEMSDSSAVPFPAATTAGTVGAIANNASNSGRHVRRPSMQFNFVFVLFPALFGLALAL